MQSREVIFLFFGSKKRVRDRNNALLLSHLYLSKMPPVSVSVFLLFFIGGGNNGMRLIRLAKGGGGGGGFITHDAAFFKTITHHANVVKLLQKVFMAISQPTE